MGSPILNAGEAVGVPCSVRDGDRGGVVARWVEFVVVGTLAAVGAAGVEAVELWVVVWINGGTGSSCSIGRELTRRAVVCVVDCAAWRDPVRVAGVAGAVSAAVACTLAVVGLPCPLASELEVFADEESVGGTKLVAG